MLVLSEHEKRSRAITQRRGECWRCVDMRNAFLDNRHGGAIGRRSVGSGVLYTHFNEERQHSFVMTNSNTELNSTKNTNSIAIPDVDMKRKGTDVNDTAWVEVEKDHDIVKNGINGPVRVILWTAPRSLSTAFERCMTRIPNSKIFNEMYAAAYLLGPQRKKQWWPKMAPKHSYKYCKKRMESDLSNYDFVFAKDFAMGMHKRTDMLPKGYQHTFLIRQPLKAFLSMKTMVCSSLVVKTLSGGGKLKRCFPVDGYFYEDMWELYVFLRDHPEYPVPIIIDADDIIRDPEGMIRKYCQTIGLPFHPDILRWEKAAFTDLPWEGAKIFRLANWMIGCYKNALNSTGFRKGGYKKDSKDESKSKTEVPRCKMSGNNDVDVDVDRTTGEVVLQNEQAMIGTKVEVTDVLNCETLGRDDFKNRTEIQDAAAVARVKINTELNCGNETVTKMAECDLSAVGSDVRKAVEYSMPFYNMLYERRVVLDKIMRI